MKLTEQSIRIREAILKASHHSGHGHIPTSFSIIECILAVYASMRHSPADIRDKNRDIFILSKGHGALGYYAVLAELGYIDYIELNTFGQYNSKLGCHADRFKIPGVEVSTGSLGHGIGVSVGMALAAKISRSNQKVYTLIGDGESNEGSVWEATMVAANLKLDNLTIIYDDNKSQGRCLPVPTPVDKFTSFGCEVALVNGHDVSALQRAFRDFRSDKPKVIVADTQKGFGCKTLVENVYEWHRRSPKNDELSVLLGELHA